MALAEGGGKTKPVPPPVSYEEYLLQQYPGGYGPAPAPAPAPETYSSPSPQVNYDQQYVAAEQGIAPQGQPVPAVPPSEYYDRGSMAQPAYQSPSPQVNYTNNQYNVPPSEYYDRGAGTTQNAPQPSPSAPAPQPENKYGSTGWDQLGASQPSFQVMEAGIIPASFTDWVADQAGKLGGATQGPRDAIADKWQAGLDATQPLRYNLGNTLFPTFEHGVLEPPQFPVDENTIGIYKPFLQALNAFEDYRWRNANDIPQEHWLGKFVNSLTPRMGAQPSGGTVTRPGEMFANQEPDNDLPFDPASVPGGGLPDGPEIYQENPYIQIGDVNRDGLVLAAPIDPAASAYPELLSRSDFDSELAYQRYLATVGLPVMSDGRLRTATRRAEPEIDVPQLPDPSGANLDLAMTEAQWNMANVHDPFTPVWVDTTAAPTITDVLGLYSFDPQRFRIWFAPDSNNPKTVTTDENGVQWVSHGSPDQVRDWAENVGSAPYTIIWDEQNQRYIPIQTWDTRSGYGSLEASRGGR